jgi:uncharacterized protein (TIGR02996 family)
MTDHDALLRAVCDAPDDDTPRLVFADLLEDRGDHLRAHFVRTQVELARVPEWDPLWAKCRQFEPGVFRGWSWSHTLPQPLPDGFSWLDHRFRRGFPWRCLALSAEAVAARAGELFAVAPIRALSFDHRSRPDLDVLAAAPGLARLRRLEFFDARLDADDLAPLCGSAFAAGLAELRFDNEAITAGGLEALAGSGLFARLASLELRNNGLPPALLVDALSAAGADGELRKLCLPAADLPAADAATLFAVPALHGLDHLDLSNNPLGPDGATALAEARAVRGVRVLKLGQTRPGPAGVKVLAASGVLAGVRWLDLSANRLGPVAVRKLAESRHARGLRVLDLSDNPVGDNGAAALAASPHLAGLVELDLEDAGVGDAGMVALADGPYLDDLLRLDLRDRRTGRPPGAEARRALLDRFGPRVSFNQ